MHNVLVWIKVLNWLEVTRSKLWLLMPWFLPSLNQHLPYYRLCNIAGPCRPRWGIRDTWWRHQMETFSASLAICAGNSPGTGEFPTQRPVTRSFDVFFDLRPYKGLSKQWRCWWFEVPSCPLWRHCNEEISLYSMLHEMTMYISWG